VRRARRIHHDYKKLKKQSIKDKGKKYKRAFLSLWRCRSSTCSETLISCCYISIRLPAILFSSMARSKTKKADADIDWNSFVQQSEPKVEDDLAETTKNYIYLVKHNFQK
jgi:hypothetical protein